jgi:hypothetical protein
VSFSSRRRKKPEPEAKTLAPEVQAILDVWVAAMRRHGRSPAIDAARDVPAATAFLKVDPVDVLAKKFDFHLLQGRGTRYMLDTARFDLAMLLKCWEQLEARRRAYEQDTASMTKRQPPSDRLEARAKLAPNASDVEPSA